MRLALVIISPIHWTNPLTGATNITGFATATFAWDQALQTAIPLGTSVYIVISSPRLELNLIPGEFGRTGIDTSSFTLKAARDSVQNMGWGALCRRPPPAAAPGRALRSTLPRRRTEAGSGIANAACCQGTPSRCCAASPRRP